jgi:hypothetical protein
MTMEDRLAAVLHRLIEFPLSKSETCSFHPENPDGTSFILSISSAASQQHQKATGD